MGQTYIGSRMGTEITPHRITHLVMIYVLIYLLLLMNWFLPLGLEDFGFPIFYGEPETIMQVVDTMTYTVLRNQQLDLLYFKMINIWKSNKLKLYPQV